jgi:hypothetical protein
MPRMQVDLNPDWTQLFEDHPKLQELIGRTPSVESMIRQDKELHAILELNPRFMDMIAANTNLTPNELRDFLLENPEVSFEIHNEYYIYSLLLMFRSDCGFAVV